MKISISDKIQLFIDKPVYISRIKEPRIDSNVNRSVSLPSPFSAILARIIHGNWIVNTYYKMSQSSSVIELSAARGRKFVHISLVDHQEITFRAKYLILWSNTIKLRTKINFSAAHLACKMSFVQVASGEGEILFEISGDPILVNDNLSKISPDRMIAWKTGTKFSPIGAYTAVDVYYNTPHLSIIGNGSVVLDSDDGEGRGVGSIFKIIKRLYIPW